MARVFITGSAAGLGLNAATALLGQGHEVVLHARDKSRFAGQHSLLEEASGVVVGDLADADQTARVAEEADAHGPLDAVIHNAGIISGSAVLAVNTVAPYILTAVMKKPRRIIFTSSGMHRSGSVDLSDIDWAGSGTSGKGTSGTGSRRGSYSDSKLYLTALSAAVARLWPDVESNAVDPGWVPTRMGGAGAPDDLELGHVTQVWLATHSDSEGPLSGGYWFHRQRQKPHPAVNQEDFQAELLWHLERHTGLSIR